MKKIFFAGFGDIARRISLQPEVTGLSIALITRSEEKFAQLTAQGFEAILDSFDDPENLGHLPLSGRTVFYTAPPPGGGFSDTRVEVFCSLISAENLPDKVIYISTSGVYGDCGGVPGDGFPGARDGFAGAADPLAHGAGLLRGAGPPILAATSRSSVSHC